MRSSSRRGALVALAAVALLAATAPGCGRRRSPDGGGAANVGDRVGDGRGDGVGAEGASVTATFTDEVGRKVTPRRVPAARVLSLAPNVTELLFAVGAGAQVVGVDNYSDQPAAALKGIPKVGSNYEPSLERIVALAPDVAFTSLSANRRETAEAMEGLGIPVFVTDTRALVEMDRTFRSLGAITGHAREAEEQIRRLHGGLDAVASTAAARRAGRPKPRVLVVVWGEPLYVAGRGTFTHDLIEVAGGTNVAADATGFAKYPLERILRLAPEVIVLPTHSAAEQGHRAVAYWSRWPELPAVKNGRVSAVEDTLVIRPGAHLVEGAALLADIFQMSSQASSHGGARAGLPGPRAEPPGQVDGPADEQPLGPPKPRAPRPP